MMTAAATMLSSCVHRVVLLPALRTAQATAARPAALRRIHTVRSALAPVTSKPMLAQPPSSQSSSQPSQTQNAPESFMSKLVKGLGVLGGFYSKRQVQARSAQLLYSSCAEQSLHPEFIRTCQLPDTFQSWFLITHLHVWMCLVRLKQEGGDGKRTYKALVELFWKDVEYRMRAMGVSDSRIIQESTRELFSMFYGLLFAYDEGLCGKDVVLAEAVWRNLFHNAKDDFEMQNVATMVKYIRREVQRLDDTDSRVLLEEGSFKFGALPVQPNL
ncbi:hypothetical protein PTSG_05233 [Salpingoeca rosetta]|uniref:Ubiquinol-cytochrome c chaperone domain-containing protein n=1 Tax=Salpingoeca rosetta (strain ATCC 50818 / BSB-021) TaxID=946362 RepID=F2UAW3_SALR5|nr:uncharacterized protein PTSG_05233 [Salpingoeca rosetta]EGD73529.1 hypothetical protein PTSG_05233 [Salpingoeca rosetta]|eukprot:XP_004993811.1 hypothetical protein PTSG_05233 [Salpingoeca rosetta]